MGSSYILTKEMAAQAIEIVKASFYKMVDLGVSERNTLHIVVMDPAKRPEFGDTFEESILCTASFGDAIDRYINIARGKANFAWMHGMPSQEGQQFYPHLYQAGMTKWGGGTFLHHIAVGASGVDYQFDQMTAEMVAVACRALAVDRLSAIFNNVNDFFE